jgi:hypothetical protein
MRYNEMAKDKFLLPLSEIASTFCGTAYTSVYSNIFLYSLIQTENISTPPY